MPFEPGKIQTYVGTGEAGYAGDGGPADQAVCTEPFMCDFDSSGNLFYTESRNNIVRRVDKATGIITTVAGTGRAGYGGDGGPATQATMKEPYSLQVDGNGDIYIVDRLNAVVRKVDGATGIISTVAGTGEQGFSGDGGPGKQAMLREPNDCFLDGKGGLLVADIQDQRIRRLDLASGRKTAPATASRPWRPVSWAPEPSVWTARATSTLPSARATESVRSTPTGS